MRQVESPLQERPFDALEFSSTARKFVLFLIKVVQIEILGYMKQSLKPNSYLKAFCCSFKRGGLFICILRQVEFHNRTQALSTQHRMLNPHVTPPMNITHCVECIGCGRLGAGQVIQSDTE